MDNPPIKVVIADDNRFFCDALKDSLSQHKELEIVNTFIKLDDLVDFLGLNTFDVLILDVNFNSENSLTYVDRLKSIAPDLKIISLTTMNNNFMKEEAYGRGVDVFLGKDSDLGNLKNIIKACFNNAINKYIKQGKKVNIDNRIFTKRKIEILQALYEHSDKKEESISQLVCITEASLKSHKRELFEITNTKNTLDLIKFGIQNGLIIP